LIEYNIMIFTPLAKITVTETETGTAYV